MALVIISANIDLSVGFGAGMLGAVTAILHVWWNLPVTLTLIIVLCLGTLIGVIQGYLVGYLRIPAFIVTLGGFLVFRGLMLTVTKGQTIPLNDNWLMAIGTAPIRKDIGLSLLLSSGIFIVLFHIVRFDNTSVPKQNETGLLSFLTSILILLCIFAFVIVMNSHKGVPILACIMFGLTFIVHLIANYTRFGRYVYAVGGNSAAAYLSGIDVRGVTLRVFAVMGALMAVAGIVMTARLGSAGPEAGRLLELEAIAACVIGGASLMGGRGTIFGAILGAFVMASLSNGMSLANMTPAWQDIITGTVLVAAVGFDMLSKKNRLS